MQRSLSNIIFSRSHDTLIEDKDTNLNKGYRVDEKDNDGGTPLHFVISDPLHLQHMQSRARSIET
jgi:hypothetical protein